MSKILTMRIGPPEGAAGGAPTIIQTPVDQWIGNGYTVVALPTTDPSASAIVTFETDHSSPFDFWAEYVSGDMLTASSATSGAKGTQISGSSFQITFTRDWIGSQSVGQNLQSYWTIYTDDGSTQISRGNFRADLGFGDAG